MARKQISGDPPPGATLLTCIKSQITKLWEAHAHKVLQYQDESADKKIKVNFTVDIDGSGVEFAVDTGIRCSQAVTDHVKSTVTDPNQGEFTEIIEDLGEPEEPKEEGAASEAPSEDPPHIEQPTAPKRGRGRPRKNAEAPTEGAA